MINPGEIFIIGAIAKETNSSFLNSIYKGMIQWDKFMLWIFLIVFIIIIIVYIYTLTKKSNNVHVVYQKKLNNQ